MIRARFVSLFSFVQFGLEVRPSLGRMLLSLLLLVVVVAVLWRSGTCSVAVCTSNDELCLVIQNPQRTRATTF